MAIFEPIYYYTAADNSSVNQGWTTQSTTYTYSTESPATIFSQCLLCKKQDKCLMKALDVQPLKDDQFHCDDYETDVGFNIVEDPHLGKDDWYMAPAIWSDHTTEYKYVGPQPETTADWRKLITNTWKVTSETNED